MHCLMTNSWNSIYTLIWAKIINTCNNCSFNRVLVAETTVYCQWSTLFSSKIEDMNDVIFLGYCIMSVGKVKDVSERCSTSIFTARPWKGRHNTPPKCWYWFTSQHGTRSRRTAVFAKTSVTTRKLTIRILFSVTLLQGKQEPQTCCT
jgi:hypothetical protein